MSDLAGTIQRQADTIEALHASAAQYKARAEAAEHLAAGRISEADTIRAYQSDNNNLRNEVFTLTERVRELEAAISRSAEANQIHSESQAQMGVQVRAYQRHNHFLQGEISARDAKMRSLEERVEFLQEEIRTKERRMSLMMDRLRKHNVDVARLNEGVGDGESVNQYALPARVTIPEVTLQQIREKMAVQTSTIEVLRDRLEALEDESTRKENVLKSLRRENDALKNTISRMVAQISAEVQTTASEMQLTAEAMTNPHSARFAQSPAGGSRYEPFDSTGSNLLLGLGGAATGGNASVTNVSRSNANDSSTSGAEVTVEDMEQRLRSFRDKRLKEYSTTKY
jgi:predicted  nucleic acid-binding Zn-ribbon protein